MFPGWIGEFARATPWAATLQVPIDIWLGRNPGGIGSALAFQLGWIVVLVLAGRTGHVARDPEGGDPGWLSHFVAPGNRLAGSTGCW